MLCARFGSLSMLELLCSEPRFALDLLNVELPLSPSGGLSFSAIWIALFGDMDRPMILFSFSSVSNYSSFSSFIYSCSLFFEFFEYSLSSPPTWDGLN